MRKKHLGAMQLGKLGGKARSKKLSKKQRKEIARGRAGTLEKSEATKEVRKEGAW